MPVEKKKKTENEKKAKKTARKVRLIPHKDKKHSQTLRLMSKVQPTFFCIDGATGAKVKPDKKYLYVMAEKMTGRTGKPDKVLEVFARGRQGSMTRRAVEGRRLRDNRIWHDFFFLSKQRSPQCQAAIRHQERTLQERHCEGRNEAGDRVVGP